MAPGPRVIVAGALLIAVFLVLIAGFVALREDGGGENQASNGTVGDGSDGVAPTPTFVSQLPETDETADPARSPAPAVEIVESPPGFTPALAGSGESECQLGSSAAVLEWQIAHPAGREQQVELVPDYNDFVPGYYLSSQSLSADTDSLTWRGLIPGVIYYWRVATRIDDVWVASQSAQFQAEDCPQADQAS